MSSELTDLTHFDGDGNARMVDVGSKQPTQRAAVASGRVLMRPETLQRIVDGRIGKGDVLAVARLAGIMATKRTADLIPLCHPLRIDAVDIQFDVDQAESSVGIVSTVSATDRTGVEMEALTAVTASALTIYDMCKSIDRAMVISDVRLERKAGGKSSDYVRG